MRIVLNKKFIAVIVALVLVIGLVPAVSAYEAHTINIKAHVKKHPTLITKTMRLATPTDWDLNKDFPNPPNGAVDYPDSYTPTVTDPTYVPLQTCIVWVVTITVNNLHDYMMYDVIVHDNFNAWLQIEVLSYDGNGVYIETEGKCDHKYRINVWDIGELDPGESATLELLVWTMKHCNNDNQTFTELGPHWLNQSGATLKWKKEPSDHGQMSYNTGPILSVDVFID